MDLILGWCQPKGSRSSRNIFQTSWRRFYKSSVCHNSIKNVVESSRNIWVTMRQRGLSLNISCHCFPCEIHNILLTLDQICRLFWMIFNASWVLSSFLKTEWWTINAENNSWKTETFRLTTYDTTGVTSLPSEPKLILFIFFFLFAVYSQKLHVCEIFWM